MEAKSEKEHCLPVAANFAHKQLLDVCEVLLCEARHVFVSHDVSPGHNWGQLSVKIQAAAQVEQAQEVTAGGFLWNLMRVRNVGVLDNML